MDSKKLKEFAAKLYTIAKTGCDERDTYREIVLQMEPCVDFTEPPKSICKIMDDLGHEEKRKEKQVDSSDGSIEHEAGLYLQQLNICLRRKLKDDGVGLLKSTRLRNGILWIEILPSSTVVKTFDESDEEYKKRKEKIAKSREDLFGKDATDREIPDTEKNRKAIEDYFSQFNPFVLKVTTRNGFIYGISVGLGKSAVLDKGIFQEKTHNPDVPSEKLTQAQIENIQHDTKEIIQTLNMIEDFDDDKLSVSAKSLIHAIYSNLCSMLEVKNRFYKEKKAQRDEDFSIVKRHDINSLLTCSLVMEHNIYDMMEEKYGLSPSIETSEYAVEIKMHLGIPIWRDTDEKISNSPFSLESSEYREEIVLMDTDKTRNALTKIAKEEFLGELARTETEYEGESAIIKSATIKTGIYDGLTFLLKKFGTPKEE